MRFPTEIAEEDARIVLAEWKLQGYEILANDELLAVKTGPNHSCVIEGSHRLSVYRRSQDGWEMLEKYLYCVDCPFQPKCELGYGFP